MRTTGWRELSWIRVAEMLDLAFQRFVPETATDILTPDTQAIGTVLPIRLSWLEIGQEPPKWWISVWTCQNFRHSIRQPLYSERHTWVIVFWKAVHWHSAFISDDTISFVILKQRRLKFNIDISACRNNENSQHASQELPKMFDKPGDKK